VVEVVGALGEEDGGGFVAHDEGDKDGGGHGPTHRSKLGPIAIGCSLGHRRRQALAQGDNFACRWGIRHGKPPRGAVIRQQSPSPRQVRAHRVPRHAPQPRSRTRSAHRGKWSVHPLPMDHRLPDGDTTNSTFRLGVDEQQTQQGFYPDRDDGDGRRAGDHPRHWRAIVSGAHRAQPRQYRDGQIVGYSGLSQK